MTQDTDLATYLMERVAEKRRKRRAVAERLQIYPDVVWMTSSEIIGIIPVHKVTIGRWVAAGKFPAPVRFGTDRGHRYWDRKEVLEWIGRRVKASRNSGEED